MKRSLIVATCITALLLGAAPAFAKGDTLTVAVPADARNLDPHMTTDSASGTGMRQVYESLVMLNDKDELTPVLCERWEVSENNTKYTFFLRKGVKFHNGETMTADDVLFSLQRATAPGSPLRMFTGYIDPKGLEKVGDDAVVIRTTQPMGDAFLASMNHPWASVVSKKAAEDTNKKIGQFPVGTGKFKFVSWTKGDQMNFERFDDYWGEKAKIKKIVLRVVVESSSRTIELESGSVDVVQDLASVDINRIRDSKGLTVHTLPGQRVFHLGLDLKMKPFDDIRVREALNMMANRKGMVKAVYKNVAEVATGPTSSAVKYNLTKETPEPVADVAKAKKLLADAGFPKGFKMDIVTPDRSDYMGIATILQSDFAKIGVEVAIKVLEYGAFLGVINSQDLHPPYIQNVWGGAPALDPFFMLTPRFMSTAPRNGNRHSYNNPKVDELLNKGAGLQDGPERAAVYHELWKILNHDLPWISLVTPSLARGMVKELKGVHFTPSFLVYYGNAYFEK